MTSSLLSHLKKSLPTKIKPWLKRALINQRAWYSQAGQDAWLVQEAFNGQRGGYFVDVGAYDGVTLSNTYLLEKRYGWRGVCVEANPIVFRSLQRYRQATCVHACLDSHEREVEFLLDGTLSSTDPCGTALLTPPPKAMRPASALAAFACVRGGSLTYW